MNSSSLADINFYNEKMKKTVKNNILNSYKEESLSEKEKINNLENKSPSEDILIPTEVETYLNVK